MISRASPLSRLSGRWAMVSAIKKCSKSVTIGLVGKYVQLHDAYLSVAEALRHAGFFLDAKVSIRWIDSELVTAETVESTLAGLVGILVPGGFGSRGIEGMILAAQYAREKNIPYFGICLGMQVAVIEYARHVLGIADASSGEFAPAALHSRKFVMAAIFLSVFCSVSACFSPHLGYGLSQTP